VSGAHSETVQILSTAAIFVVALVVHGVRGGERLVRVSLLLVLAAELLLNLTFYRAGWSGSDKWFVPFLLLDAFYKFAACILAATVVLLLRQRRMERGNMDAE
jgi:hypothetical protein